MDIQLAVEALEALLEVTVKPLPEEHVPSNGPSEVVLAGSLLKAMMIGDAAPSRHTGENTAPSKLTIESLTSTVVDLQFQSQASNDDAGLFLSLDSAVNSLTDSRMSSIQILRKEIFVNMGEFFDRRFDYDFRHGSDSSECSRGGEPYARPWGWYRFALKVLDKYPDGNAWLGPGGWRSSSADGEWPVSFHGTGTDGAKAIASSHYKAGLGMAFGSGIYSTPDIKVAEQYTRKFTSKKGKTYEVIMQNRINHERRKIIEGRDYWLIPVPQGTSLEEAKKIAEESIRPYGILIKGVKENS